MALEDLKNLDDVLDIQLAGGISTLEDGFMIGYFRDKELSAICLAINRQGEVFARFMKDETVHHAKDLSRAELEAIALLEESGYEEGDWRIEG